MDGRHSDQDQAACGRNRARNDKRVTQAESVDRNTESDRQQPGRGHQQANSHQDESHRVYVPLPVRERRPHSLTNCGGLPDHPQAPLCYSVIESTID